MAGCCFSIPYCILCLNYWIVNTFGQTTTWKHCLCVCVCVCVDIFIHYVKMLMHVYVFVCLHTCAHTCVSQCICVSRCVCVCLWWCTCACVCVKPTNLPNKPNQTAMRKKSGTMNCSLFVSRLPDPQLKLTPHQRKRHISWTGFLCLCFSLALMWVRRKLGWAGGCFLGYVERKREEGGEALCTPGQLQARDEIVHPMCFTEDYKAKFGKES